MPIGLLHQTDLFRPYNDPDDHWDLACVYALAARGAFVLRGVLIDAPPHSRFAPDVEAVAQMNCLHGVAVPCAIGSSQPLAAPGDTLAGRDRVEHAGARWLLTMLEASHEPVFITIVGSCRDVALAANSEPELFRQRCAGVLLNAGYGAPRLAPEWELEYNVQRDVAAYRAMFNLPCPLYWLPCFEDERRGEVTEWGTLWWFRQGEVLETLSVGLQRYFAYALGQVAEPGWHQYLSAGDQQQILRVVGADDRFMWSTAGIFHAAGLTVGTGGEIAPVGSPGIDPVYEFLRVRVHCSAAGQTSWDRDTGSGDQYLFRVRYREHYRSAMTRALGDLLQTTLGSPR